MELYVLQAIEEEGLRLSFHVVIIMTSDLSKLHPAKCIGKALLMFFLLLGTFLLIPSQVSFTTCEVSYQYSCQGLYLLSGSAPLLVEVFTSMEPEARRCFF